MERIEQLIVDERVKRLIDWAQGKPAPPLFLEIWPTFRCNLRCLFCDYRYKRDMNDSMADYSKEVSEERLIKLIKEANDAGVKVIRIVGGGEPMLRIDTAMSIMKLAKKFDMIGTLTTNGTLFTKKSIESLVKIGWDKIEFSIDGPDANINDYLRGIKGSFYKTVNSIKMFSSYKKIYGKDKPQLFFSTIMTKLTYDKIEDFLKLADSIGVECISLLELIVKTPQSQNLKLTDQENAILYENLIKAKELRQKYKTALGFEGIICQKYVKMKETDEFLIQDVKDKLLNFLTLPCYEPWYYLQVISDGRISPCCACYINNDDKSIHTESLMSLWMCEHLESIRNKIFTKKMDKNCLVCSSWQVFRTNSIRDQLIQGYLNEFPNKEKEIRKIAGIARKKLPSNKNI